MNARVVRRTAQVILIALMLAACGGGNQEPTAEASGPTNTPGPEVVVPQTTSVPDPADAASAYLAAWSEFDYASMYEMLTQLSKDAMPIEQFEERYREVSIESTLTSVDYEVLQKLTSPSNAQVGFQVTLNSALAGPVTRDSLMDLSMENGQWKVVWGDQLILPELAGGNRLSMQVSTPSRGIIYDRNNEALASTSEAVALSVIPSAVAEENVGGLLSQLSVINNLPVGYLRESIFSEDAPYLTPAGVVPVDAFNQRETYLEGYFDVLSYQNYFTRLYLLGSGGAHALGYVSSIPAEEVDEWSRRGYPVDATVGRQGLESWGEEFLAGKRGGELYVVNADKTQQITILNSREAEPAQSIHTTLDASLQRWAQLSIKDFTGAVVVLERDTGRILAMASSPTFDPNDADFNNPNSQWGNYFDGTLVQPFLNRATQGQYPPGSIFKVITMAAALESGLYTPQSSFLCEHTWNKLGAELEDWTLEKGLPASGELTLQEGLMRSCNPWFYEIGFSLYGAELQTAIADMARGFGLGSPTGLEELPEEAGQITNPNESTTGSEPVFNAVQQAIGQSDTLITPLQAAVYVAALGNGGTLLRPQLIERIEDVNGTNTHTFTPEETGTLPVSEENLSAIQAAMRMVINNPRGTAYRTFANMNTTVFGKTGTAQNPGVDAHAWFIGYTNTNSQENPDIAIAVVLEDQGDGSEFAAPIFRRLVEVYFTGGPQRGFPWESQIGVLDEEYFAEEVETEDTENGNGGEVVTPVP